MNKINKTLMFITLLVALPSALHSIVAELPVYGMHSPFLAFGLEKFIFLHLQGLTDLHVDLNKGSVTVNVQGTTLDIKTLQCCAWWAGFHAGETVTITTPGMVIQDKNGDYLFYVEGDTNKFYLVHQDEFKKLSPELQKIIPTLASSKKPATVNAVFCIDDHECNMMHAETIMALEPIKPPSCCPCSQNVTF